MSVTMVKPDQKSAALVTLGCPKNQVDSEILAGILNRHHIPLVANAEEADVILINTCGFIESAKSESIHAIMETLEKKKTRPGCRVVVWGCLSQRYREELTREIPEVDQFFGIEAYSEILKNVFGIGEAVDTAGFNPRILSTPPHTAYLKIADGCDHRCSFCAIPLIKGRFRSRSADSLVYEASRLAVQGVKEIILIAQDTSWYGHDLEDNAELTDLLRKLTRIRELEWIRIMYTHPLHMSDALIDMMASEEKICKYVDMPLQHISDPLLRAMQRGSGRTAIEKLIAKMRNRIPDLTLRSAFILGFPGETEAMFQELADFVQEIRFERLGCFMYSREENTAAALLKAEIPESVKQKRYHHIMGLQQRISEENNRRMEGRILRVLIDGYDAAQHLSFGRSEGDAPEIDQTVWIEGRISAGSIVPVQIQASAAYDLMGVVK